MVEIVVHLVAALYLPAAEHIDIIPRRIARIDNAHQTGLVGIRFGLAEIHVGVAYRLVAHLGARCRIEVAHTEGMVALHDGIRRDAVYAHRVMSRELAVILQVIQTLIQRLPDACIRSQHIAFSVQFEADAVGVRMVSLASVERCHQAVACVHAVALYQPAHIGRIKRRRHIVVYLAGFHLLVQHQRLIGEKRSDGYRHTGWLSCLAGFRVELAEHRREFPFFSFLAVLLRVLNQVTEHIGAQRSRMRIAPAAQHPVGEQVLRQGFYRLRDNRNLHGQVGLQVTVKQVGKRNIVAHHVHAVARTLRPNACSGIKSVIRQLLQRPLAKRRLVDYIIDVIAPALPVGISGIVFQYQCHVHDITCLNQVPVVMRHTVGDDVFYPFLERPGIHRHLFGTGLLQVIIKKIIQWYQLVQDVFVNHLERGHAHQGLLVPVIQVDRHVAVINARHIRIEHRCRHPSIRLLAGQPPQESSIAGDAHYLAVDALYHAPRLADVHPLLGIPFQRSVRQIYALRVFGVRLQLFQLGAAVVGCMAACAGKHHRRRRRAIASGMVVHLSFYIYVGSVGVPVHLQTRCQPSFFTSGIGVSTPFQSVEHLPCPRFFLNQP